LRPSEREGNASSTIAEESSPDGNKRSPSVELRALRGAETRSKDRPDYVSGNVNV